MRAAGWAPVLVFLLHVLISRVFGAYLAVPVLDMPMHLLGGVAIAFFLWRAVGQSQAPALLGDLSLLGRALLAFCAVCTAAGFWEFAEWSSDYLGVTQAQLGLNDTMLDMFLGILGGTVFLGFTYQRAARRARWPEKATVVALPPDESLHRPSGSALRCVKRVEEKS